MCIILPVQCGRTWAASNAFRFSRQLMVSLLTFQQLPCQPESLAEGAEAMGSASLWSRAVIKALVPCVEDPGYLGSLGLKSVFLWQLNETGG